MLIGQGAETFAAEQGLEIMDPSYFYTQHRWNVGNTNAAWGHKYQLQLFVARCVCCGTRTASFSDGAALISDAVRDVTPVPEPETYAMLLAGLGLLGFVAHRRKENS